MFRSAKLFLSRAYSISHEEIAEFKKLSIKDIAKALGLDRSYIEKIDCTLLRRGTNPHQLSCTLTFKTRSLSPFQHDEDMVQEAMIEVKKISNLLKRHEIDCSYNSVYGYNHFYEINYLSPDDELTLCFSVDTKFMNLVSESNRNTCHKFQ